MFVTVQNDADRLLMSGGPGFAVSFFSKRKKCFPIALFSSSLSIHFLSLGSWDVGEVLILTRYYL